MTRPRPLPLLATLVLTLTLYTMAQPPIHLDAGQGQLVGVIRATTRPGYSGTGYVTGFVTEADKLVLPATIPSAGIYDVSIRYCSPSGRKGYVLAVDDLKLTGMFGPTTQAFVEHPAGKVELEAGPTTLAVEKGWGHYDIDSITLAPSAPIEPPVRPPAKLSDPEATPQAQALLAALISGYGNRTLSGVQSLEDAEYVQQTVGQIPAILGADLIEYSPSRIEHGSDPKGIVEAMIGQSRAGRTITMCWHWNAPSGLLDQMRTDDQGKEINALWWRGFYTEATTFDVKKAMEDERSAEHELLVRDMDAIAVQLQKFADAGVPVLWRPLHEAEGGWFWWGGKGPQPFVKLWRLMYDRLTRVHHLHNLIWVYTSDGDPAWYPGDDVVDIIGVDGYPPDVRDSLSETWQRVGKQFAGKKLMALTEFGGVPDIDRMHRLGCDWAYFVSWTGDLGPRKLPPDDLRRIYNSPFISNLASATK